MSPEVKRQFLPTPRVYELLDELWGMGTREIYMAGGGEPFMHPDIMGIVRRIKEIGFTLFINTNFTLVDRDRARELVDLGVDHLTVSVWAGSAETYSLVHPNKTEETFHRICDVLRFVNSTKSVRPFVKLYQVISCLNYHEIPRMVELARETGCESLEYTLVDTMPGATESLLLNDSERRRAVELLAQARSEAEGVEIFNVELFERRISNVDSVEGAHDSDFIHSIPCTIGWTFSRILPDGNVNACLKAHRIPVGNILEQSFSEIWNSEAQRNFRRHTNVLEKKDPFFRQIGNDPNAECGCVKSCDDIGRNLHTLEAIQALSPLQRRVLRQAAQKLGPEVKGAD
jgi:MoaA/NifB/PqqE/SkfB family radical SAM enzyme